MPEMTIASAPTPTLAPLDHIGSFLCPTPAKMLEMPLNNRATAASVIMTRAAKNTGNAIAATARAMIISIPIPT
jgi:hypothetical protein